ncbi:hypothetical protein F5Y07DRAFT_373101 [Xylaria sp. FL0933]|nr:hypothetical protein F5Y07DRAFT_373101 [Xylaria sp. FL0933]
MTILLQVFLNYVFLYQPAQIFRMRCISIVVALALFLPMAAENAASANRITARNSPRVERVVDRYKIPPQIRSPVVGVKGVTGQKTG